MVLVYRLVGPRDRLVSAMSRRFSGMGSAIRRRRDAASEDTLGRAQDPEVCTTRNQRRWRAQVRKGRATGSLIPATGRTDTGHSSLPIRTSLSPSTHLRKKTSPPAVGAGGEVFRMRGAPGGCGQQNGQQPAWMPAHVTSTVICGQGSGKQLDPWGVGSISSHVQLSQAMSTVRQSRSRVG